MGLAMNVALKIGAEESPVEEKDLKSSYIGSLKLIEQLHRLLLDVIKDEFERLGRTDVNSIQALLLYNIGDDEVTAVRVSLTEKGLEVCDVVNRLFERQLGSLEQVGGVAHDDLENLNKSMFRLQRFWSDQIRYQL
jgi:hypothetical protein